MLSFPIKLLIVVILINKQEATPPDDFHHDFASIIISKQRHTLNTKKHSSSGTPVVFQRGDCNYLNPFKIEGHIYITWGVDLAYARKIYRIDYDHSLHAADVRKEIKRTFSIYKEKSFDLTYNDQCYSKDGKAYCSVSKPQSWVIFFFNPMKKEDKETDYFSNKFSDLCKVDVYTTAFKKSVDWVTVRKDNYLYSASLPTPSEEDYHNYFKWKPHYLYFNTYITNMIDATTPAAWFTIQFDIPRLVTAYGFYVFHNPSTDVPPQMFLAFRFNRDENFELYMENYNIKYFTYDTTKTKQLEFELQNPFIASQVRLHHLIHDQMSFITPYFRYYRSYNFNAVRHYIFSQHYKEVSKNIIIELGKPHLVSSINVIALDLKSYCIKYELNGKVFDYRFNILGNHTAVFKSNVQVTMRSFYAEKLTLSCLKRSSDVTDVTVHLKGLRRSYPDHLWMESIVNDEIYYNGTCYYYDHSNSGINLKGTADDLKKETPESIVRSSHIGPDCLSRPHLCDTGFVIGFQNEGGVGELKDTLYFRLSAFVSRGLKTFNKDNDQTKIITTRESYVSVLLYKNIMFHSNSNYEMVLRFGDIITSSQDIDVNVYLYPSQREVNYHDNPQSYLDTYNWIYYSNTWKQFYSFIYTMKSEGSNSVILTQHIRNAAEKLSVVFNLLILVTPVDGSANQVFGIEPTTYIQLNNFQRKVPRSIYSFQCEEKLIEGLFTTYTFANPVILTGFRGDRIALGGAGATAVYMLFETPTGDDFFTGTELAFHYSMEDLREMKVETKLDFLLRLRNGYIVDFLYPVRVHKGLRVQFYDTNHNRKNILNADLTFIGQEYEEESIFHPIFSSGLHGNTNETGVSIYYDSDDQTINVNVHTDEKKYHVKQIITEVGSKLSSYIIVWKTNEKLELYLNDKLVNSDETGIKFDFPVGTTWHQEYYQFFGYYDFHFSYTKINMSKFFIWKKYMDIDNVVEAVKEIEYKAIYPESYYMGDFKLGSHCNCTYEVCPCNTEEHTIQQNFTVMEYNYIDENFTTFTDEYTEGYWDVASWFNITSLDLPFINILAVNMHITTSGTGSSTCFEYSFGTTLYARKDVMCQIWNASVTYKSPDLKSSFIPYTKDSSTDKNKLKLSYKCYTIRVTQLIFSVTYQPPAKDLFWYLEAYDSYDHYIHTVHELDEFEHVQCFSFMMEIQGDGFSFVTVELTTEFNTTQLLRLYPHLYRTWTNITIPMDGESSEKTLRFILVRSGTGRGYVGIKRLRKDKSQTCSLQPIEHSANSGVFDDIKNTMMSISLTPPLLLIPSDYTFKPLHDIKSIVSGAHNVTSYIATKDVFQNDAVYSHDPLNYVMEITNLFEFTVCTWIYTHPSYMMFKIEFMKENNITETLEITYPYYSSDNLILKYSNQEVVLVSSPGYYLLKYVVLQYSTWNKKLKVVYDMNNIFEFDLDLDLPSMTSISINIWRLHCFQFYGDYLDEVEYNTTSLCPTKLSKNACNPAEKQCEGDVCNHLTQRWEAKTFNSQFKDDNCKHILSESLNVDSYYDMDTNIVNLKGDSEPLEIDPECMGFTEPGVINNALCFHQCQRIKKIEANPTFCNSGSCSISGWIKHDCNNTGGKIIFRAGLFVISCSNEGITHIDVDIGKCIHTFSVGMRTWYHMTITSENKELKSFYMDGEEKKALNRSCENTARISMRFSIGAFVEGCLDELIFHTKVFTDEQVMSMYLNTIHGYGNSSEQIKKVLTPFYFTGSLKSTTYSSKLGANGYYENQFHIDMILNETEAYKTANNLTELIHIEVIYQSTSIYVVALYFSNLLPTTFTNLGVSKTSGDRYNFLDTNKYPAVTVANDEAIKLLNNQLRTSVTEMGEINKTQVIVTWKQSQTQRKYPVTSVGVSVYSEHGDYLEYISKTPNHIVLNGLRPYTTYSFVVIPITLRGWLLVPYSTSFQTLEGEPYVAPTLYGITATKGRDDSSDTLAGSLIVMTPQEFGGVPHSYEIFITPTNKIENLTEPSSWDLTKFKNRSILYASGNYQFEFNTDLVYENYTLVSRATSQGGLGLGVISYVVVRSAIGSPEQAPSDIVIVFNKTEEVFQLSWVGLPTDENIWNAPNPPGSYYITSGEFAYKFSDHSFVQSSSKKLKSSVKTNHTSITMEYDNVTLYFFSVGAKGQGGGNRRHQSCIILQPSKTAPTVTAVVGKIVSKSSTSFHIGMSPRNPLRWQGSKKFYIVLAIKCFDSCNVYSPAADDPFIDDSLLTYFLSLDSTLSVNLYPVTNNATHSYYKYKMNVSHGIDDYTNGSKPCSKTSLNKIISTWDYKEFTIHAMEHNREYTLQIAACNEFGCTPPKIDDYRTEESTPSCPPPNITLQNTSSTEIEISWDELPSCSNGIVLSYELILYRPKSNTIINMTTKLEFISIPLLDKYEYVCVKVSASTKIGQGVESEKHCGYTGEDLPEVAPEVSYAATTTSSVLKFILTQPNEIDINGILLGVYVYYKPSANNIYSSTFDKDALSPTINPVIPLTNLPGTPGIPLTNLPGSPGIPLTNLPGSPGIPLTNLPGSPEAAVTNLPGLYFDLPEPMGGIESPNEFIEKDFSRVEWKINREDFFTSEGRTSFYLRELSFFTEYEIYLSYFTSIGKGNKTKKFIYRTLQDVPSAPPTDLQLQEKNSTSIFITWSKLSNHLWNGIPATYQVTLLEFLRNNTINRINYIQEADNENSSMSIENLQPYTNCSVLLYSCTVIGCSENSTRITLTTNESAPIDYPVSNLIIKTSTSLHLKWNEVNIMKQYGVILDYTLTIKPYIFLPTNHTANGINLTVTESSFLSQSNFTADEYVVEEREIVFNSLKKYVEYEITIKARNAKGYGPTDYFVYRTAVDLPTHAPKNFTTEGETGTSINISWLEIPFDDRNGVILGYVIYYNEVLLNGSLGHTQSVITNASTFFLLNGLTLKGSYNMTIAGYTSKGVGIRSDVRYAETGLFEHGNFTLWSEWGGCSVSCGGGVSIRRRECTNPRPFNGGLNCTGKSVDSRLCGNATCSGIFLSNAGNYHCGLFCKSLNALCDSFILTNNKSDLYSKSNVNCSNDESKKVWNNSFDPSYHVGEERCQGYVSVPKWLSCKGSTEGDPNIRVLCNCLSQEDIGFNPWAEWSPCSTTCGDSVRRKKRLCAFSAEEAEQRNVCTGIAARFEFCDTPECPIDGNWGNWTEFNECNETCGYGYRIRQRFCEDPKAEFGGMECPGPFEDFIKGCNPTPCPVHGGVTEWLPWETCLAPCGNSTQIRRRYCTNPAPAYRGDDCAANLTEIQDCVLKECQEIDINYIVRFDQEEWYYKLFYHTREEAKPLTKKIKDSIMTEYKNSSYISEIVINGLSKGSVIADFTIYYSYIDGEQVLAFVDSVNRKGFINNMSVAEYRTNSTTVSCDPPVNITSLSMSQTEVFISWDRVECTGNVTTQNLYVYFRPLDMLHKDIEYSADMFSLTWQKRGVPPDAKSIVLKDLTENMKYKGYLFPASNIGNGRPSESFMIETRVGKPSIVPLEVHSLSISSTQIFVEWEDIPVEYHNGPLKGYKIKYKKYLDPTFREKFIDYGYTNSILENLTPFTLYWIDICGFTAGGEGPVEFAIVKTLEGVPDIPVPDFMVTDMQSIEWWSISWGPIPERHVNGILRGYRLMYYMSARSDITIGGETVRFEKDFDVFTFYYKATKLVNYATYKVTVTGFTNAGNGPAPEYYARTCKCLEHLYSLWYDQPPYNKYDGSKLTGLFPDLIRDMVVDACGSCKKYSKSQLHYYTTRSGDPNNQYDEETLKQTMSSDIEVAFPFYSKPGRTVAPDSLYLQVTGTPGFSILVRDESSVAAKVEKMIIGVLNVWPLLLVSYCIATLFGILIWFSDQFLNPEEFVIGQSLKGPMVGFWFSFVTMTTVGYGDFTPRSIIARSIAMAWFLVGLTLNGIIIGFIATALTTVGLVEEVNIYGSKAAVIMGTYEYRYAIRKNAIVSENVTYTNITSMLTALQSKEVDMIIIDAYLLGDYKDDMTTMKIKVKKTIDEGTGYGLALSGLAKVLYNDIEGLLLLKKTKILEFIESMEDEVPKMEVEESGAATADIFSAESVAFQKSAIVMGVLIFLGTVLGVSFNCYQNYRKRHKVEPEECDEDRYLQMAEMIENCLNNLKEIDEKLDETHTTELGDLTTMKKAYARKLKQIGKKGADKIVFKSFKHEKDIINDVKIASGNSNC